MTSFSRASLGSSCGSRSSSATWRSCSSSYSRSSTSTADCRSELERARKSAEARVGFLSVEGRYHRLPRRFEDDFELAEGVKLGNGRNGDVLLTRCRRTGVAHAVKSYRKVYADPCKKKRLASEVDNYFSMDHPHIARLTAVYESDTEVKLVMECCSGGELRDRVKESGALSEEEAAKAIWQMLLAISYMHWEGVVHRDIKLENFVYDEEGSDFLKLIDFGFSSTFQESAAMQECLGTVQYMAPEVLNKSYVGGSCDMWSLGVSAFAMLSGQLPFRGRSNSAIIQAIKRGTLDIDSGPWLRISEAARDFVARLLVIEPGDRMTARQALQHPFLAQREGCNFFPSPCQSLPNSDATAQIARDAPGAFLGFAEATRFQQVVMALMAWTLPRAEHRLLRDLFSHRMDTAHTGVLPFAELNRILKKEYGMHRLDRWAVIRAMARLDSDKDGELHYSDFVAVMMVPRLQRGDREGAEEVFRCLDAEGLGYLSEEPLWRAVQQHAPKAEFDDTFCALDADGDGKIYLQEFVDYLHGALQVSSSCGLRGLLWRGGRRFKTYP